MQKLHTASYNPLMLDKQGFVETVCYNRGRFKFQEARLHAAWTKMICGKHVKRQSIPYPIILSTHWHAHTDTHIHTHTHTHNHNTHTHMLRCAGLPRPLSHTAVNGARGSSAAAGAAHHENGGGGQGQQGGNSSVRNMNTKICHVPMPLSGVDSCPVMHTLFWPVQ